MFVWISRLVDYFFSRCSWCKERLKGELCDCEGGELIVWDDSTDI